LLFRRRVAGELMVPAGELGRPHEAKAVAEQGGAGGAQLVVGSQRAGAPPRSRRPGAAAERVVVDRRLVLEFRAFY